MDMLHEYASIVELSKLPKKKKELLYYLVGFADAEGCFSVALKKQAGTRFGWVLDPVFCVAQHARHKAILQLFAKVLQCGRVIEKPGQPGTLQFYVDNRRHLSEKVIPFFERYRLIAKARDFEKFASIVRALEEKKHTDRGAFRALVIKAFEMNLMGKQRRHTLSEVLKDLETPAPQRLYAEHSRE